MQCAPPPPLRPFGGVGSSTSAIGWMTPRIAHLAALPMTPSNVVRGLSSASLVLDDLEALAGPTYGRKCAKSQRYTTCQVRCLTYLLSCTSPPLVTHARDRRGPSDGGHRLRVMLPSSSSSRTHQIALAYRVGPFLTSGFFSSEPPKVPMNSRTSSSTAGTASTHFMALLPIISDRRRRVRAADQLHKQTKTPGAESGT